MKKFFITGVSDGLGKRLCNDLLLRGHIVYGISRQECKIDDEIDKRYNLNFIWKYCDVTKPEDIYNVIAHQQSIGFLPDIVILNAGAHLNQRKDFVFTDCQKLFQSNCEGALRWVDAFIPAFKGRGHGHFVYISSYSAIFAAPFSFSYSASKRYTSFVLDCLRKQYSRDNIDFTNIYLGLLDTKMSAHLDVPLFLKYPIKKATRKIIKCISNRKKNYCLPVRSLLLHLILALAPDRVLLKLMSDK